ncbi:TraB/GumN family protein [Vibrio sp. 03-59-1]|nr:TraB/GumN family protein [Vibrio sp. 03-59-1]
MIKASRVRTFLLGISFFISALAHAEPLYWSATKGDKELIILGSVHVGNASLYPLPSFILQYLKQSDGLIVETDTRKDHGIRYPSTTITSEELLSKKQQQKLKTIARQLEIAPDHLLQSPPWATALTIQAKQFKQLGYSSEYGIDNNLMIQATLSDKPVIGLESLQFQIDLITQLPNGGIELLASGLEEWDDGEDITHCLIKSWKAGDIENLQQLSEESEINHVISERFVFQRNHDWADKLDGDQLIQEKGRYLVVVGTLHLAGERNLISLLERKGFAIHQRSKSTPAGCEF